jgi:hypothetical protein
MHTESEGFLAADLNYDQQDSDPEVYIRKYLGKNMNERKSVSSLWEIEINNQHVKGSTIKVSDAGWDLHPFSGYKLRHL